MLRIPTAGLFVVALATAATAAEIKVFCPGALRPAMSELVPEFERAFAHKVTIQYGTAGALADRIQTGETADVAILTPPQIENFAKQGAVAGDSKGNVGKIGIGVAVSKGAAKPDIGSVDSFKRSMLAANSIAYIDPATGGPAGIYLARLFERLGIAADIASKTKLTRGPAQDAVIKGEAEIVITQITELITEPKVDLVGPLPAAIQNSTQFTGGMLIASKERDAATAFIRFLASPTATSILKSKGVEPG
jgi:molybdate transport system substrate-binding protein